MVELSIVQLLLGAGTEIALERALDRAVKRIQGFRQRDRVGRLLALLHDEYGATAGLSQQGFDAWREDLELLAALEAAVAGSSDAGDADALAGRIAPHLEGVIDPHGLAAQIADTAVKVAPLVQNEIPESTSFLTNRLEASTDLLSRQSQEETGEILAAVTRLDRLNEEGEAVGTLGKALLTGPLELAGARNLVERAQAIADSDPAAAAGLLAEASKRLDAEGLAAFAEIYATRAAESYAAAGEVVAAASLFEQAAFGQIHRASSLASITVRSFQRAAPAQQAWRAEALGATLDWVGDPQGALADLRTAVLRSDRDPRWITELAEALVLVEEWPELRELTEQTHSGVTTAQEVRFRLARADAASALGEVGAEAEWNEVLVWADTQGPQQGGVAWQRRAMRLALDDRAHEARDAYRTAIEHWLSAGVRYADDISDAYYSGLTVETNAAMKSESLELMPLAAELRGPAMTPAARAEMRLGVAMRQHLGKRYREGFFSLGQALRLARLNGSLSGTLEAMELMAQLLEAADHPDAALFYFVRAGKGKEGARLARLLTPEQICDVLDLDGPGWVRVASYRVIKEVGRSLPDEWVAGHLDRMLDDAEGPAAEWLGPNPRYSARVAISATALQAAEDLRPRVLEIVEQEFWGGMPESREVAGQILVFGTSAQIWQRTETAVDGFLAEPQYSGVDVRWVAERAERDTAVMNRLIEAATEGSRPALEAVSLVEPIPERAELRRLATELLAGYGSLNAVQREEGHIRTSIRRLAHLGGLARLADDEVLEALVAKLVALTADAEEPESSRTSGAEALFNLIPILDRRQLSSVIETLRPLAEGHYQPSAFDREQTTDPLAFFRLNLHQPNSLRAVALLAMSRAEAELGVESTIGPQILEALQARDSKLATGGLEAVAYAPSAVDPAWIQARLDDEGLGVRRAAVRALIAARALDEGLIGRILSDPHAVARQPLLEIDEPAELRELARRRMADDPDAYLRALARAQDQSEPAAA